MPSHLGWVDFTEADRQRMLDVISLFREQDTLDELGIGSIRDAFANYFFPGTSTIQTRARYMLFVPWIYLNLEKKLARSKKLTSAEVAWKVRKEEIKLIHALLESDDTAGLIGKEAKEKLKRMPSSVYWGGLGTWGIRLFPGSQEQYHQFLCSSPSRRISLILDDNGDPVEGYQGENWDPGIPDPPEGFPRKASFALTREEATFLKDRIILYHKDSVLAYMVTSEKHFTEDFLWDSDLITDLPHLLQQIVYDARNFSELMHGAALLYNLMLAEKRGNPEWVEKYETLFRDWAERISLRMGELQLWHSKLEIFWRSQALEQAKIPRRTKLFVKGWLYHVFNESCLQDLALNIQVRELIMLREIQLKKGRARFTNQRTLDLWGGASGTNQLDFRWSNATVIANDIIQGYYYGSDEDV